MARAHIVGAGLSGLSAALQLMDRGHEVRLYEAAGEAGGRCRSFHDVALDRRIDNGNHLLLSGNVSTMRFLDRIGSRDSLVGPPEARLNFVDLRTGERWCVRPNRGVVPRWIFSPERRVAGTTPFDYLSACKVMRARAGDRVGDLLPPAGLLYERFWEPMVVGALNIAPDRAAAILLRSVFSETFARGADACRPLVAKVGLGATFVDPALAALNEGGASVSHGMRLKGFETSGDRVTRLSFGSDAVDVADDDVTVIAVPQWVACALLPGYAGPAGAEPIVNVHYRLSGPVEGMGEDPALGVVGGTAQWIFARDDVVSVTISAATREAELNGGAIAAEAWRDVVAALRLGDPPLPRWRVIKERRATFVQTPKQVGLRPGARTEFVNLALAGDWTDTGLPATIEGSIRSGEIAARCLTESRSGK